MAYHHIQALGEAAIICASFRTFLSDITKKNVSSSNISLINVFTNPSYSFKSRSEKIFSKVFITEVASTSAVCNRNEDFELAKRKMKAKQIKHINGVGMNTDRFRKK